MNRRRMLGAMAAMTTTGFAGPAIGQSESSGGRSLSWQSIGNSAETRRTGPRNLITDVAGLKIGQSQDTKVKTGVTLILPDSPAVAASDVRGGGPATRETDVLSPENLVQEVDGIVFSGGSVYGMAASDGITAAMGAEGRGFALRATPGIPPSPILPAACLYDLANGGDKDWGVEPPYRTLGVEALNAAAIDFALGTAGAGYGANSGGVKGGIGSASAVTRDGVTVGAITAVNSLGSALVAESKHFWAAPFEIDEEFGGLGVADITISPEDYGRAMRPRTNTTLACVATDMSFNRVELQRIAIMAQDGMARALRPSHAPFDGDVVFALSTAQQDAPENSYRPVLATRVGALAADVLSRAIARAVFEATALSGSDIPAWRDL